MKIGLDAGLIGAEMFTMLMVMALLTTAMTGPLMTLFLGRGACYRFGSRDALGSLAQS
jgi:hypothetical protein